MPFEAKLIGLSKIPYDKGNLTFIEGEKNEKKHKTIIILN